MVDQKLSVVMIRAKGEIAMTTSKRVAREAGKELESRGTRKIDRSVAASALSQAKKKQTKKR